MSRAHSSRGRASGKPAKNLRGIDELVYSIQERANFDAPLTEEQTAKLNGLVQLLESQRYERPQVTPRVELAAAAMRLVIQYILAHGPRAERTSGGGMPITERELELVNERRRKAGRVPIPASERSMFREELTERATDILYASANKIARLDAEDGSSRRGITGGKRTGANAKRIAERTTIAAVKRLEQKLQGSVAPRSLAKRIAEELNTVSVERVRQIRRELKQKPT